MELWIRTQDKKKLIKTQYLYIVYSKESDCVYVGDQIAGHIAKYKDEKRALEVLDEIQKYLIYSRNAEINNMNFLKYLDIEKCYKILNNISVYEMPEE